MTVKPVSFDDGTGMWTYVHDDARPEPHGGTLDPATVTYGTNTDGSPNQDVVLVPCPFAGCGSVSYWPPGGGADALMGQEMHVLVLHNTPQVGRSALSLAEAADQVKQRVIATDGEERWVIDDAVLDVLRTQTGAT